MSFSVKRLTKLIGNEVVGKGHAIFIYTITAAIILLLIDLFNNTALEHNFHTGTFSLLLFVGGFWISSIAFTCLHSKEQSIFYLTIPCSNLEKLLSKLLLTSIIYVVALSAFYYIISLLAAFENMLVFHISQVLFNPFDPDVLRTIVYYLVLQSTFILGSIYFKRSPATKTILTLAVLVLFFIVFGFIVLNLTTKSSMLPPIMVISDLMSILHSTFLITLAPVCWVLSYLKLREAEVR
ncbi:MAG: hypothetical protein JXR42_01660 [Gammaproteobacteria bacterium]|nr:hypothetical protein [Gammaproteobacteria bacterium]